MISRTCGYAIRGVVFLALSKNIGRKVGLCEITDELKVPQHFMGKILQELVKKAILKSFKGPNGGFCANSSTLSLSIITIVEAIDGLGVLKKCFLGLEECSSQNPCSMHGEFENCRREIFKTFQRKKISDFVEEIEGSSAFLSN